MCVSILTQISPLCGKLRKKLDPNHHFPMVDIDNK